MNWLANCFLLIVSVSLLGQDPSGPPEISEAVKKQFQERIKIAETLPVLERSMARKQVVADYRKLLEESDSVTVVDETPLSDIDFSTSNDQKILTDLMIDQDKAVGDVLFMNKWTEPTVQVTIKQLEEAILHCEQAYTLTWPQRERELKKAQSRMKSVRDKLMIQLSSVPGYKGLAQETELIQTTDEVDESADTAIREEGDKTETKAIERYVGTGFSPMVAVLFSPGFETNNFEVIKQPDNPGDTDNTNNMDDPDNTQNESLEMGLIQNSREGGIAGVLFAAEVPLTSFNFNVKSVDNKMVPGRTIPVGGWFGVQLQTGADGAAVEDISLAAGLSTVLLSKQKKERLIENFFETDASKIKSLRLLLGVMYGTSNQLHNTFSGAEWSLTEDIPIKKKAEFKLTFGLGFRF